LIWRYLVIHHTGAEEKDTEQVRRYHKILGWVDIGYNFVIERNGLVVPGRSLKMPGAHCRAAGMNRKGIGVAIIGNLEEHPPEPAQVDALVRLLVRLMRQYHIPVENVLGHREVPGAATACPGRYFPLDEVRRKVRAHLSQTWRWDNVGGGYIDRGQTVPEDSTGSGRTGKYHTVSQDADGSGHAHPGPDQMPPICAAVETQAELDGLTAQNRNDDYLVSPGPDHEPPRSAMRKTPVEPGQTPPQNRSNTAAMPVPTDRALAHNQRQDRQNASPGLWIVQAGAFSTRERAKLYAQKLQKLGIKTSIKKESQ
jgi:N-acetylmuramoyl-L-alanine amidase